MLALAAAAVAAAPFLVPVDRYRPLLEQFIHSSTGRDVHIGTLRLELWPRIHVHAADVRLGNPTGFPPGDAIAAASVDLGVNPRALLRRTLMITYIAVSGVRVNVLSDDAGRTNYDLPVRPQGIAPEPAGAAATGQPLLSLGRVGGVTLKNVDLAFGGFDARRNQVTPAFALTGLSARVRRIDTGAEDWLKRLDIAANLRGGRLVVPFLTAPVRIRSGALLLTRGRGTGAFAVALDDLRATGTVTINSLTPPAVAFTMTIPELDANRLQQMLRARGGPAAQTGPGPRHLLARGDLAIGKFVFSPFEANRIHGRLSVYSDAVRVDSYSLSALGGTARGTGTLDYAATGAPASTTVRVHGLNLGKVASLFNPTGPKIAGALDADLRLVTAFGRDPRAALSGSGTFTIRGLVVSSLEAAQAAGRLSVRAGRLELPTFALSAYGGTAQGTAALDFSSGNFPTAVTATVRGVSLGRLMGALSRQGPKLTGGLAADFRLATVLGRDPEGALSGAGTFAVRNGSFPGLDLKSNLVQAARAAQLNVPAGDTRFSYFGGDFRIARERVYSNSLRLDAEGLAGTGHGSLGFDQTLNYAGTGVLTSLGATAAPGLGALPSAAGLLGQSIPGAAASAGARVPFSIAGTFGAPKFALAGTPQFIQRPGPRPSQAQPRPQFPQLPSLQDLLKPPP